MNHIKWTDIQSLHNLRKRFDATAQYHKEEDTEYTYPCVIYEAKVKLRGTNAGIQVSPSGEVVAQSRSALLSVGDDNHGFAAWVAGYQEQWAALAGDRTIVVYGEWCGRGINKGTALSNTNHKHFDVFAIQYGEDDEAGLLVDPVAIEEVLVGRCPVSVIPWCGFCVVIDYASVACLGEAAAQINKWVAAVEEQDPYVKSVYGVDGIGEGLVFYPIALSMWPRAAITDYIFKAKGEKHQVVKSRTPASIDPETAASVGGFVELTVTEGRLEQGLQEVCNGVAESKAIGPFLKWVGQDVRKECVLELEASGLEWKQVSKPMNQKAVMWFKMQAQLLEG